MTKNSFMKSFEDLFCWYGGDFHLSLLQDNCAGLIVEANHVRLPSREGDILFMERMAEVELSLAQIKTLFPKEEYRKIKARKVKILLDEYYLEKGN